MAGKYDQYVVRKPLGIGGYGPEFIYNGDNDYKSDFTMMFLRITEPTLMEEYAHSHDFPIYLYFMSFDHDNWGELDADIEIGLGPEREIHKITQTTSVYIPAGMVHCPLHFKRVGKPLLFIHATMAPKYEKDPNKIIKA